MASTTHRQSPHEGGTDPIDIKISENVRKAIAVGRTTKTALARQINMPTVTFFRKLDGTSRWHASEVYAVAVALGIDAKKELFPKLPLLERAA